VLDTKERASRIDWDQERERYVTGADSLAEVARRVGVSKKAVELHAAASANLGRTWGESRAEYRSNRDASVRKGVGENQADLMKQISARRGEVALTALNLIAEMMPAGELKVRDLVEIAKLGIDQRLQITASTEPRQVEIPMTPEECGRIRLLTEFALGRPPSSYTPEQREELRKVMEPVLGPFSDHHAQGDDHNVSHGSDQVR